MSEEFVPFGGELAEKGPSPQFVRHESDTSSDPQPQTEPSPMAQPEKPEGDITAQLNGILAEHLGADIDDDAMQNAVEAIAKAVHTDTSPTSLGLPDLKLQNLSAEATGEGEAPSQQPEISLEKDDGKVTRIKVDCTCGEAIVMDVSY